MKADGTLDLPRIDASSQDTIFEYMVDDNGQWVHWKEKVCIA